MTTITADTVFTDIDDTESAKPKRLSRIFNKAADILGRAAVTNVIRVAAVSAVAGAGASSIVGIGTAAVSAGVGSFLYTYAKDTYADYRTHQQNKAAAKHEKPAEPFKWWDIGRAKKARTAFLSGVAGGAFGAWLAGTDTFKSCLDLAMTWGGRGLSALGDFLMGSAQAATPAAALAPVAPFVAPEIPAAVTTPDIAATPAVEEKPANALGRMIEAVKSSAAASGALQAELQKVDPADMASLPGWFLKDRAHDILRVTDIPLADRLAMARELAEAAIERGSRQAPGFLADVAKMEIAAGLAPAPAAAAVADLVTDTYVESTATVGETMVSKFTATYVDEATGEIISRSGTITVQPVTGDDALFEPAAETASAASPFDAPYQAPHPEDAAELATPGDIVPAQENVLQAETAAATSAAVETMGIGADAAPVVVEPLDGQTAAAVFGDVAATCTVTPDAGDIYSNTVCMIDKDIMQPGDKISFAYNGAAHVSVETTLAAGSTPMATEDFLHEKVIADGLHRLSGLNVNIKTGL